jgi:hypothetical protein
VTVTGPLTVFALVAVIVAVVGVVTAAVVIGNVALTDPCGIVTDAGTMTAGLLLLNVTAAPPAGADEGSDIVPVALLPPEMEDGLKLTPPSVTCAPAGAGVTVTVPLRLFALVAVIVAVAGVVTAVVDMGKVAMADPCGTVAVAGTVTAGLLLLRLTATPPVPAGEARGTVPVPVWPPTMVCGVSVNPPIVPVPGKDGEPPPAVTASVADSPDPAAAPSMEAPTVTVAEPADDGTAMRNSPFVWPCGINSDGATAAAVEFDVSMTSVPPAGAGDPSVTEPVALPPALTCAGEIVSEATEGEDALPLVLAAGTTVSDPDPLIPDPETVNVTGAGDVTAGAVSVTTPTTWPAGIVTLEGRSAMGTLLVI